jgi:threonine dehydratase
MPVPTPAPVTNDVLAALPVSIDDVRAARERVMGRLYRTPLFHTPTLSRMTNSELRLKCENLQRTGSFKTRGALNAALRLDEAARAKGVVTFSAGNHGQGVAYAAQMLGMKATVYMASTAVPAKVAAIRGYGAEVVFGEGIDQAVAKMNEAIAAGATYISPFDDRHVIAGQGIVGLEILEDCPDVEEIVIAIGGGGLISGIATTVKTLRPDVRIVGVQPEGAHAVYDGLISGQPVRLASTNTIADGLAAPFTGVLTQQIIGALVDDVVLVSDDEIRQAMAVILERTKLLAEPAGAAATAALLTGKAGVASGARVVATISGGNVSLDRLKTLL